MEKTLTKILFEIKSLIQTPFLLRSEEGRAVFGDDIIGDTQAMPIRLCDREYVLMVDAALPHVKDFCLLLQELVNTRLDERLHHFINRRDFNIEDFPFPCGLILIESRSTAKITSIFYGLFDEGFVWRREGSLAFILPTSDLQELKEIAMAFYQTLSEEVTGNALISIGGIANSREELVKIHKSAENALKFASSFNTGVIYYPQRALGRLLSFLPKDEVKQFTDTIGSDLLKDPEMLQSIRGVLECNLNMSEAARRLYIHRNTLIYRLEKIAADTGLDIRNFKDAVTMEILLMLKASVP